MEPSVIKTKSGYSLMEVIIAVTLFVTVVAISSGSFVSLLRNQRAASSQSNYSNAIEFVLEEMIRNARTAINMHCTRVTGSDGNLGSIKIPSDCDSQNNTANAFIFTADNQNISTIYAYWYDSVNTKKFYQKKFPVNLQPNAYNALPWQPVFDANVSVRNFQLNVSGTNPGDFLQPRARIILSVIDTTKLSTPAPTGNVSGGTGKDFSEEPKRATEDLTNLKVYQFSVTPRILQI